MDNRKRIPIEELLYWVYQKQKADIIYDLGAGLYEAEKAADGINIYSRSSDGCVVVARDGELGGRVDGGGMLPSGQLHPDAEKIHEVIRKMSKQDAYILIRHAKMGGGPDILNGIIPKFRAVTHVRGKKKGSPVMIYNDNKKAIATKIAIDYPPYYVDSCREFYNMWYNLLVKLSNMKWDLKKYIPAMPRVSSAPWDKSKKARKKELEMA